MGITVNGDQSHSKETKGGSACTGGLGRNAMNVSAPMVMIGAVSPIARAMPMITPVMMPGVAIRDDVIGGGLPFRRAERVGTFPYHSRYPTYGFPRCDNHDRQDQEREREAGGEDALSEPEL